MKSHCDAWVYWRKGREQLSACFENRPTVENCTIFFWPKSFRGVRHPQKEVIAVCAPGDVHLPMRSDRENWRLGYDQVAHDQTRGGKMHKKCLRATRSRQRHKAKEWCTFVAIYATTPSRPSFREASKHRFKVAHLCNKGGILRMSPPQSWPTCPYMVIPQFPLSAAARSSW